MKRITNMMLLLLMVLFLTSCFKIPIGDGKKIQLNKGGITFTDEEGDEHKLNITEDGLTVQEGKTGENVLDVSKDGVIVTGEDGREGKLTADEDGHIKMEGFGEDGAETTFEMGENLDVPKSLPKDIPLTNDANIMVANDQNQGIWVNYVTNESIEAIDKLYKKYFNSKNFIGKPEIFEQRADNAHVKVYEGKRKDGTLTVQFSNYDQHEYKNQVMIMYYVEND